MATTTATASHPSSHGDSHDDCDDASDRHDHQHHGHKHDHQDLHLIEQRGNVQANPETALLTLVQPLEFKMTTINGSAVDAFRDESLARAVCKDLAETLNVVKCPMIIQGHTKGQAGGDSTFWRKVAYNRALAVCQMMVNFGADGNWLYPQGIPGRFGKNAANVEVYIVKDSKDDQDRGDSFASILAQKLERQSPPPVWAVPKASPNPPYANSQDLSELRRRSTSSIASSAFVPDPGMRSQFKWPPLEGDGRRPSQQRQQPSVPPISVTRQASAPQLQETPQPIFALTRWRQIPVQSPSTSNWGSDEKFA